MLFLSVRGGKGFSKKKSSSKSQMSNDILLGGKSSSSAASQAPDLCLSALIALRTVIVSVGPILKPSLLKDIQVSIVKLSMEIQQPQPAFLVRNVNTWREMER